MVKLAYKKIFGDKVLMNLEMTKRYILLLCPSWSSIKMLLLLLI